MSLIMCVIVSMAIVTPRARGCGSAGVTLSIERFTFRAPRVFALAFTDCNEGSPCLLLVCRASKNNHFSISMIDMI